MRKVAQRAIRSARFSTIIPPTRLGRGSNLPSVSQQWKPLAPFVDEISGLGSRIFDELDRDFFSKAIGQLQKSFDEIPLDIKESPNGFDLQVDLPGIKKEDIHIDLKDRVLTISAEKKGMEKETGDTFRRIERYRGHVTRSISLPDDLDADHITAGYADGVLHLKLPKVPEAERPSAKVITIK